MPPGQEAALMVSKWNTLPANRRDKFFWTALNGYLEPLFAPDFPLLHEGFHSLTGATCHSGEVQAAISEEVVSAANAKRGYFDSVSLWNPLSLAAHLDISVNIVIEQLLLAKEYGLVRMKFVVTCQSCGCDMLTVNSVGEICFRATYHKTNIVRCPMCTERNVVNNLDQVGVYFQDAAEHPLIQRKYHRLFISDEAKRRRLETYFCPPKAAYRFCMRLPEGRYLIVASGVGLVVEVVVHTGAEYAERNRPYQEINLLIEKLIAQNHNNSEESVEGTEEDKEVNVARYKRTVINVPLGKVAFRVYNDTRFSTYIDIFVAFDERLEFIASKRPAVATVPMVLNHSTRGLRSPLFYLFVPAHPGARTSGVYVLHSFALPCECLDEVIESGRESVVAIIREVHRYSLEDHSGLLLSVGLGGATYESSFLSYTAALASSLCFAQRVVTRLGEEVAGALLCTITSGKMYMGSFQGQYDDAENERSAYPSVQLVGPAVYAATHPPATSLTYDEKSIGQQSGGCVRFELRSVSDNNTGICLDPNTADEMFQPFLAYIKENIAGVVVVNEPQALVVSIPLSTLNAKVKLSSLVDATTYTKDIHGPFG
ncbi:hypothetical protein ERJ75_000777500 [Trypanosoma vivax]|uniref:Uncharacterized protein n=1 Tax=Trypanosoma vivax (strain Y486) TaxID=1055687 RepID=G0U3E8_TRYVY|nr:hypothetical protein TRVL_00524 [Trypanosoma vivax]KAH8613696.1 hypothetical protein ERJ75_000777500 [Trypanosoma vivax]CCC50805.1 conserved hypothetical protein [Trypanosoma vivax Y486]